LAFCPGPGGRPPRKFLFRQRREGATKLFGLRREAKRPAAFARTKRGAIFRRLARSKAVSPLRSATADLQRCRTNNCPGNCFTSRFISRLNNAAFTAMRSNDSAFAGGVIRLIGHRRCAEKTA